MTEINFFQFHKKYGVVYLYYEENFKMLCACINQYGNKQNTKRIFKKFLKTIELENSFDRTQH